MKSITSIDVQQIKENPWHFRLMYESDFASLASTIKNDGMENVPKPVIAKIKSKYYIVDGHSRIKAAKKAGIKKLSCQMARNVKTLHELRVSAFKLNKEGYSNPLLLSDMFYEDMQLTKNVDVIASEYNVNPKYVSTILKIRELHDDVKSVINKILENSKKKYQFILNQITPEHLASIAELDSVKQTEVVDWIFRDIMYGPTDETLVSIPSVYEVLEEIERISETRQRNPYKKRTHETKLREFPLTCRCGLKFDINTKTNTVYEYMEQNNIIIKKKFEINNKIKSFSSKTYPKEELIRLIKNSKSEVSVVVAEGNYDETRQ